MVQEPMNTSQDPDGSSMAVRDLEDGYELLPREEPQASNKTEPPQGSWSSALRTMAILLILMCMMGVALWHAPPTAISALRKALTKATQAGIPAAGAMAVQVFALMWLRTIINYQYR